MLSKLFKLVKYESSKCFNMPLIERRRRTRIVQIGWRILNNIFMTLSHKLTDQLNVHGLTDQLNVISKKNMNKL
jgi:hypothetical protein